MQSSRCGIPHSRTWIHNQIRSDQIRSDRSDVCCLSLRLNCGTDGWTEEAQKNLIIKTRFWVFLISIDPIMRQVLATSLILLGGASAFSTPMTMGTGNSFGRAFRISTWGESHGGGVGVSLDGCPPRIHITRDEIQKDLDRRRPGQSRITTPRNEADAVEILSGLNPDDITLGTPIAMLVRNKDQRSNDYLDNDMKVAYRPSHADATYDAKYGVRAIAGGGRSSARETIGRVAAGAIARKILKLYNNIEILAYVSKVQEIETKDVDHDTFTMEDVDANIVRCPDPAVAEKMLERIDYIRKTGNSIGGVVTCVARNVPAGLGGPVFDKLEADLAKACMSIPAAKGFESGDGFEGTLLTGKEHNDEFYIDPETGATRTKTNRSGGIQGGISNGENIVIRVAFKPTSTIGQGQVSIRMSCRRNALQSDDFAHSVFSQLCHHTTGHCHKRGARG
jgi:chorismate synthase